MLARCLSAARPRASGQPPAAAARSLHDVHAQAPPYPLVGRWWEHDAAWSDSYLTIATTAEAEIEVSVPISGAPRAPDEAAAWVSVEAAPERHWDARHHCSAYILGPGGEVQRLSDDGEPVRHGRRAHARLLEPRHLRRRRRGHALVRRHAAGHGRLISRLQRGAARGGRAARVSERRHVQRVQRGHGARRWPLRERAARPRGAPAVAHVVDQASAAARAPRHHYSERASLDQLVAQLTGGQARVLTTSGAGPTSPPASGRDAPHASRGTGQHRPTNRYHRGGTRHREAMRRRSSPISRGRSRPRPPIRRSLGYRCSASTPGPRTKAHELIILEHDERSSGHEELYLIAGRATFTVGDERIDATGRHDRL